MRRQNNFTDGMCVGIVVGGDINDPAPDHSGGMRIFIPGLHGKDVQVKHLAFSSMQKAATNLSQQAFEGVLDPGSVVYVRKDTGSNMCHILGTANEIFDPDSKIPGALDLVNTLPQIQQALKKTINIRIPPQIQEQMVNGVRVRIPQEKNELHRHNLLAGIPANGAIYSLAGSIVPNVVNVSTAIQSFNNILTPAIASLLPGLNVSMGNLLTSLATGKLVGSLAGNIVGAVTGGILPSQIVGAVGLAATTMITSKEMRNLSRQLLSGLSPQMRTTFRSMSLMTSSIETGVGGGFMTGGRVDPMFYMTNAVGLLGKCRGVGDMVYCMQQLQYDSRLYGTSRLPNITIMIDTPFGIKLPLSIDPSGLISQNIPAPLQALISTFTSSLTKSNLFPGVNPGENLFGASAATMFNMYNRMAPEIQNVAINLAKKLNQSAPANVFAATNRITNRGGNPFGSMFL